MPLVIVIKLPHLRDVKTEMRCLAAFKNIIVIGSFFQLGRLINMGANKLNKNIRTWEDSNV